MMIAPGEQKEFALKQLSLASAPRLLFQQY